MRTIKFRAWSETLKDWVFPATTFRLNPGTIGVIEKTDPNDIILMQYTGLKDKNGKEIYEGDILRIPIKPKRDLFVIKWENKDFYRNCLYQITKGGGLNFHPNIILTQKGEVIGNIYENKELLK